MTAATGARLCHEVGGEKYLTSKHAQFLRWQGLPD